MNRRYLEAYFELSAGRSFGEFSPHPISTAEIGAYCALFRIDSLEERDRLYKLIRRLDTVFLQHMAKKAEVKKP